MSTRTKSTGKQPSRTKADRLYRLAWLLVVAFVIGVLMSLTPLLWWILPAEFIDTVATLGITVLLGSCVAIAIVEGLLWWDTLW